LQHHLPIARGLRRCRTSAPDGRACQHLTQTRGIHRQQNDVQQQDRIDTVNDAKTANRTLLQSATTRSGTIVRMQKVARTLAEAA
jgi:hypothetical protein